MHDTELTPSYGRGAEVLRSCDEQRSARRAQVAAWGFAEGAGWLDHLRGDDVADAGLALGTASLRVYRPEALLEMLSEESAPEPFDGHPEWPAQAETFARMVLFGTELERLDWESEQENIRSRNAERTFGSVLERYPGVLHRAISVISTLSQDDRWSFSSSITVDVIAAMSGYEIARRRVS